MADVIEDLSRAERGAEAPPETPPTKRRARIIIIPAILLILLAGGAWAYLHFRNRVSTDDAQIDADVTSIAPRIPGQVIEVMVRDNQPVKAGDLLVRVDPRDYQARVDQAKAAVEQARSQLNTAQTVVPLTSETTQSGAASASAQLSDAVAELERSRIAAEQAATSEIAAAEANVRARQANNDRAQADLARMKPLLDKAEISQQQYDSYLAAARVAEASCAWRSRSSLPPARTRKCGVHPSTPRSPR